MSVTSRRPNSGAIPATLSPPAAMETPLSMDQIVAGQFYGFGLIPNLKRFIPDRGLDWPASFPS